MTCVISKAYVYWQSCCMRMSKDITRSLTEEQRLMRIITLQLSFILNLSTMWTVKGRKPDGDIYLDFRSFNNCAQQIQHPLVGYFNDMRIENRIKPNEREDTMLLYFTVSNVRSISKLCDFPLWQSVKRMMVNRWKYAPPLITKIWKVRKFTSTVRMTGNTENVLSKRVERRCR